MILRIQLSLFLVILVSILVRCTTVPNETPKNTNNTELSYATKFVIHESEVQVLEPWPGAVTPKTYTFDQVPDRLVVTSTTHLPFLEMLGVDDRLVGFPGTNYISSEKIRERVNSGAVVELGNEGSMNLELLLSTQPDLVIAFDMGNESTTLDKIEESGIPVLYNADFLERSTLGRAEWIKFFGAIFDKREQADSIFTVIENNYDSLKFLASKVDNRPSAFSGVMYGDTWFLPGGQNWSARFIKDAGGAYIWEQDSTSGWLEISFESVFDKANQADFWLGISTFNSKAELIGQDARYGEFKAFQTGLYTYNKRISPTGGYDFFESGYARPDLVLADLIKILHPELLPEYETYYFQKVP